MKILIAGFEGEDNSAKILLDNIKNNWNEDILYLKNDFEIEISSFFTPFIVNSQAFFI